MLINFNVYLEYRFGDLATDSYRAKATNFKGEISAREATESHLSRMNQVNVN
ncbi:MAG: hypothetical protein CM15mP54_20790 [Paracoccaceae bacterium]|nr:MAG: hypothetical protein CM15mP54_20790 [Paracoccaceae bacterium]